MDYQIAQLIPNFHVLFSDAAVDTAWLVALAVYVMLIVVICSLTVQSVMTLLGLRRIHFFRNLIYDYDAETLRHQRSNIITNAYSDFYCGELWSRFDQSLIHYRDNDCLQHTSDLAAIFNQYTLTRVPKGLIQVTLGLLLAVFLLGIVGVNLVDIQSLGNSLPGLVLSIWCVGAILVYLPISIAMMATVNSDSKKLREIIETRYPKFNIFSAVVALAEDVMALANSPAIQTRKPSPDAAHQHQPLSNSAQIELEDTKGFDWKSSIENYQQALTTITQQQIARAHETLEVKLDRFLDHVEHTLNDDEPLLDHPLSTDVELTDKETTDTYMVDEDTDMDEYLPHRKTPTFILSDSKGLEESMLESGSKPEQEPMSASIEKSIPEAVKKPLPDAVEKPIPAPAKKLIPEAIKTPLPESVPDEVLARSIRLQQHLDAHSAVQQPSAVSDPNNSSYGNTLDRLLSLRKNKNSK